MNTAISASAKTFWKYLAWTGLAAAVVEAINQLPNIEIPIIIVPILASVLKSLATYAATQAAQNKP